MKSVREDKIYCPRFKDLKPLPCPDPPPKEILLEAVVKVTTEKNLDIGAEEGKVPDRDWLLNVLSIHKPNHEFFNKDYLPP